MDIAMPFPTRREYDRAMRNHSATLLVTDPPLQTGSCRAISAGTHGHRGMVAVYRIMLKKDGRRSDHTVRCFLNDVFEKSGLQARYELIERFLHDRLPAITVPVTYHAKGIRVEREDGETVLCPVVVMDWVNGVTLAEFLDEICDDFGAASILEQLAKRWLDLVRELDELGIGHGDLAANNIVIAPDGRLVLIDYDFAWLPEFEHASGIGRGIVGGQEGYLDPFARTRSGQEFDRYIDRFSALVIYISLLVLRAEPALWRDPLFAQGRPLGVLLLQQSDLDQPHTSERFAKLLGIDDEAASIAVEALWNACIRGQRELERVDALIEREHRRRLANQREPLTFVVEGDELVIRGQWPDDIAGEVFVTWCPGRFPVNPDAPGVPRELLQADQSGAEQRIAVGHLNGDISVAIYPAVWYEPLNRHMLDVVDPLLTCVARRRVTVYCRVKVQPHSSDRERYCLLECWTTDGTPVPPLAVVRRAGRAPWNASVGQPVTIVGDGRSDVLLKPIDAGWFPPTTYLGIFPADPADGTWLTVVGNCFRVS
jgi:hypothetical protein